LAVCMVGAVLAVKNEKLLRGFKAVNRVVQRHVALVRAVGAASYLPLFIWTGHGFEKGITFPKTPTETVC